MPISIQHRHALLLADRTHDVGVISTVVTEVLAANPDTNLLEIEQAFRDNAAATYLVAKTEGFEVVLGLLAMLTAVGKAGITSAEPGGAGGQTRSEEMKRPLEPHARLYDKVSEVPSRSPYRRWRQISRWRQTAKAR